jgi:hypothetical protein
MVLWVNMGCSYVSDGDVGRVAASRFVEAMARSPEVACAELFYAIHCRRTFHALLYAGTRAELAD